MYKSLQAGRAIAAMLVVLFHLGLNLAKENYFGLKVLGVPFAFGSSGVEFFFVLSGFIILTAHFDDIGRPSRFFSYVRKRLLRIFPTYWLIFLPIFAVALAVPSMRDGVPQDVITVVKSLLLIPQDKTVVGGTGAPVIIVAWTLQYEMLFYFFFSLLVLAPVAARVIAALVVVLYGMGLVLGVGNYPFFLYFIAQDYVLLFGMGMLVAWMFATKRSLPAMKPTWALGGGLALFALTALDVVLATDILETYKVLIYGLASMFIVYGLVALERAGHVYMGNRWMQLLGDASYAMYLIHFPLISVLCKVAMAMHLQNLGIVGALLSFVVIFVACLVVSVLFHVWVERPIAAYFRKSRTV